MGKKYLKTYNHCIDTGPFTALRFGFNSNFNFHHRAGAIISILVFNIGKGKFAHKEAQIIATFKMGHKKQKKGS